MIPVFISSNEGTKAQRVFFQLLAVIRGTAFRSNWSIIFRPKFKLKQLIKKLRTIISTADIGNKSAYL